MGDLLLLRSTTGVTKPALWRRRFFECKTCSRKFPTFQALGGHRTSHKRPIGAATPPAGKTPPASSPEKKKKLHYCPVCGAEFFMGQALGGHMRRHRYDADTAAPAAAPAAEDGRRDEKKARVLDLNLPVGTVEVLLEEVPLFRFV